MGEEAELERIVAGQEDKMTAEAGSGSRGDHSPLDNSKKNCHQNETDKEDAAPASSSSSPSSEDKISVNKGKSCKGCLYYSSTFKSNSRNPLCVGISRSLPHGITPKRFNFYAILSLEMFKFSVKCCDLFHRFRT